MESKEKVELLERAIKVLLIDEQKASTKTSSSSSHGESSDSFVAVADYGDDDRIDENHHLPLISKLLSQLDSLKEDGAPEQLQESGVKELHPSETNEKSATADEIGGRSSETIGNEQIIKELREIKKQNSMTHWLLSVMIALTLAWQLSEVSLILKLREGLSNPIKSIGGMIMGMFKRPAVNGDQVEKDAVAKQNGILQAYSLPGVKVPEIPHSLFSDDE